MPSSSAEPSALARRPGALRRGVRIAVALAWVFYAATVTEAWWKVFLVPGGNVVALGVITAFGVFAMGAVTVQVQELLAGRTPVDADLRVDD